MKHYKRGFLNKGEGMAAFEANIDFNADEDIYTSVCASFAVSDCSRKIELDFYASDAERVENNLHKIDTLLEELKEFRFKLVAAYYEANFKPEDSE